MAERVPAAWGTTDPEIVSAAQDGCERSFEALYSHLRERVRRTAARILRDEHAAEDTMQDTFLAVLEGLPELTDPLAFETWVLRIARFKAISAARHRDRCATSSRVHDDEGYGEQPGFGIARRSGAAELGPLSAVLLRSAYADLSPTVRETLRMKYRDGLSCEAIARRQHVSLSCVKTRLHRGRRDLYDALGTQPG